MVVLRGAIGVEQEPDLRVTHVVSFTPGAEKRLYDHRVYEEQMFFFNRMTRVQYYEHNLDSYLEGRNSELDHCFDCAR